MIFDIIAIIMCLLCIGYFIKDIILKRKRAIVVEVTELHPNC